MFNETKPNKVTLGVLGGEDGLRAVAFGPFGSICSLNVVEHWQKHGNGTAYVNDCAVEIEAVPNYAGLLLDPSTKPHQFRIKPGLGISMCSNNPNYAHDPYHKAVKYLGCQAAIGTVNEKGFATVSFERLPEEPEQQDEPELLENWLSIVNEPSPIISSEFNSTDLVQAIFGRSPLTRDVLNAFGKKQTIHVDGIPLKVEIMMISTSIDRAGSLVTMHLTPIGKALLFNGNPEIMGKDLIKCHHIAVHLPFDLESSIVIFPTIEYVALLSK